MRAPPADRPYWDVEHRIWTPDTTVSASTEGQPLPRVEPREPWEHAPDRSAWDAEHGIWVPDWTD